MSGASVRNDSRSGVDEGVISVRRNYECASGPRPALASASSAEFLPPSPSHLSRSLRGRRRAEREGAVARTISSFHPRDRVRRGGEPRATCRSDDPAIDRANQEVRSLNPYRVAGHFVNRAKTRINFSSEFLVISGQAKVRMAPATFAFRSCVLHLVIRSRQFIESDTFIKIPPGVSWFARLTTRKRTKGIDESRRVLPSSMSA